MSDEALPTADEATAERVAHWEQVYKRKRRELLRYRKKGRENSDPCPLDEPAKMPGWWKRNMRQSVPSDFLEAAISAARSEGAASSSPSPVAPAPQPPRESPTESAYDFAAQVARLRDEQQRIQTQLDRARRGSMVGEEIVVNQADCESLLRQSLELTAELRKAENDLTKWLEARELLVNRDMVRGENARIAGAIFSAVIRMVGRMRPLLAGKTDAEQDKLWKSAVVTCFEALKEAKFTDYEAAIGPLA